MSGLANQFLKDLGSALRHGEDDERASSDDYTVLPEYNVGHVVFKQWEIESKIGEGSAGFVYKATDLICGKEVALKLAKSLGDRRTMLREATIMEQLNHHNIVAFIDIESTTVERITVITEYVRAGSLASQIHRLRKRTERELWIPMKQMADAVKYMHSQNIVHRDIKPQNVLFSDEGILTVIDFKAARPFFTRREKMFTCCGTCGYMAPEITAHGYEGPPVDVWALGVLFTKLFVGLQFDGCNIIEMSHDKTDFNVGKSSPTFARETLVSLLTAMLRKDPMKRLTMREVVNHTWFLENEPKECFWNAEPKVINESVEEEYAKSQGPNVSVEEEYAKPQVPNVSAEEDYGEPQVTNVSAEEEYGEPQVTNISAEEEPLPGSSLCDGEDDERASSEADKSTTNKDDESTSSEEYEELEVGQVVVSKTFDYLFTVVARNRQMPWRENTNLLARSTWLGIQASLPGAFTPGLVDPQRAGSACPLIVLAWQNRSSSFSQPPARCPDTAVHNEIHNKEKNQKDIDAERDKSAMLRETKM
uniref:uncharacterized protein n=1 Tax=Myxine glutinosa TaxID=7769 RepID=UPI00358E6035